jgi:hypothetical protein
MAQLITSRRIVISLILAACFVGLGYGLSLSRTPKPLVDDPRVMALTPQRGELVLRQARIGVTLAPGFTLAEADAPGFSINGTGIPQDQLDIIPGLNQYFFTPGSGKDVSQLPPCRNCVSLRIQRIGDQTYHGPPFSWCFVSH